MFETPATRIIPIKAISRDAALSVEKSLAMAKGQSNASPLDILGLPNITAEGGDDENARTLSEKLDAVEISTDEIEEINPVLIERLVPANEAAFPKTVTEMVDRAERTISTILSRGTPICVASSFGKDSSVLLSLVLSAASKLAEKGVDVPPIVVTTADTGIENPEMVTYYQAEQHKVIAFAKKYGLDVSVKTSSPNLTDQWSVRVIGGRALPPFPGGNHDCTIDWKQRPQNKMRRQVFKTLYLGLDKDSQIEPIVMIGTRYAESEERRRKMTERGESDVEIRRGLGANGKPTDLFLSPICFWSTDDIWEFLASVEIGLYRSYSDFEETKRVYRDAMGECIMAGEDEGKAKKAKKACGARHGCAICTAVGIDKSMVNMIASDPKYSYMAGLNRLQQFLVNTRWDMDRRTWIGRSITKNHVRIAPDIYSPKMLEDLLLYSMTIDRDEQIAASELGIRPRFELVSMEQLVAIDANWSLQAYHKPFHALYLHHQVHDRGHRFPVPDIAALPKLDKMPTPIYFPVADWDEGGDKTYTGLRDHMIDLVKSDGDGCMGNRTLKDGREVLDMNNSNAFSVDFESVMMLLDFEFDQMMDIHGDPKASPLDAYMFYARYGTISVAPGKQGEIDDMVRRARFKVRNGLHGAVDHRVLLERSKSAREAGIIESDNGKKLVRGAAGSKSITIEVFSGGDDVTSEKINDDEQPAQPGIDSAARIAA